MKVEFLPVSRAELLSDATFAESSATVAARVEAARRRAAARLRDTPWRLNAEIPGSELRRGYAPAPGALAPLERAMDLGQISARGVRPGDPGGLDAGRPGRGAAPDRRPDRCGARPVAGGTAMTRDLGGQDRDRLARAALTWIAEPGDAQLGPLLRQCSPAAVIAALTARGAPPGLPGHPGPGPGPAALGRPAR